MADAINNIAFGDCELVKFAVLPYFLGNVVNMTKADWFRFNWSKGTILFLCASVLTSFSFASISKKGCK
jgi:hypothetical protein